MTRGRRLDVALTPADAGPAHVAVVVDVLRATSSIVTGLEAGYQRVLCVESLECARALRTHDRVLAGERGCVPPLDFDIGNSPREFETPHATEVVLATTNGAPAIVAAAGQAARVVVGALVNLEAVAAHIADAGDVQIVCAGTGGRAALEDVYAAGRLLDLLDGALTDAARIAVSVSRSFATAYTALAQSANARVLERLGLAADVAWCASESIFEVVPEVLAGGAGVAVVEAPDSQKSMIQDQNFAGILYERA